MGAKVLQTGENSIFSGRILGVKRGGNGDILGIFLFAVRIGSMMVIRVMRVNGAQGCLIRDIVPASDGIMVAPRDRSLPCPAKEF